MNTIHHEQPVNQVNWRYAMKQFDPQHKPSPEDWAALAEALVPAPSETAEHCNSGAIK